ncbi:MAG: YfhO family protein [Actinomycetota bacterium]|nr:YfhO family protein [Actinomycetota bacterium]
MSTDPLIASEPPATSRPGAPARPGRLECFAPLGMVAAAVAFGLVALRSELTPVAYLNDSSVHAEMVRFAAAQLRAGRLPLESWYPYLGLGSPQFMHYQSLGATLTGALGLLIGPDHAFRLSLYLLVSTWPISIYLAGRLFGIDRWRSGAAAMCSPFVVSILGIGYSEVSYLFVGFGLWSQLFGMWTLPLAWGATARALRDRRFIPLAGIAVAATAAFHFMTGYLAFGVVPLFALVLPGPRWRRLVSAAGVLAVAFSASAWVIVPLLHFRPWASINESLAGGPDVNSYGAATALRWLADGQLLDARHWPVLTVLSGIGALGTCWRWPREPAGRPLLVGFALSLVLFFGTSGLGPLIHLLPGHQDLFMRRFLMGVQLACIFFAGRGLIAAVRALVALARRARLGALAGGPARRLSLGGLVAIGILAPAWSAVASTDLSNSRYIAAQRLADEGPGTDLAELVAITRRLGGGRIYAGMPSNWGLGFSIGAVPVFRYLAALDADEVGFTLRTASLMTNPEVHFQQDNPGDYSVFGVRFLVLPAAMAPPVPARLVARRGPFALWTRGRARYVSVVDTIAPPIAANRADLGAATAAFLASAAPGQDRYPLVAFDGARAAAPSSHGTLAGAPGRVLKEQDALAAGRYAATLTARRRAVVLLHSSYDPGWVATVDGRRVPTEMVAPALVGVPVGPGRHRVVFTYHRYGALPDLLGLAVLTLAASALGPLAWSWRRRRDQERPSRSASAISTGSSTSAGSKPSTRE